MPVVPYSPKLLGLVIDILVAVVGYLIARWAGRRLRETGAPPSAVHTARFAITAVTIAVAIGVLVEFTDGLSLVSGLTLSAVGGLAATLALQTMLQNMVAGFVMVRHRMLRLNDTIQIAGITGKVVQLGLVTTWLRLEDGSVAFVSNSNLLSGPLINRSAGDRLKGEY